MNNLKTMFALCVCIASLSACSFDDGKKAPPEAKTEKQREDVIYDTGAESDAIGNPGPGLGSINSPPTNSGNSGLIGGVSGVGGGNMGGAGAIGGGMHR